MLVWRSIIIHFQRFPTAFLWVLELDSYAQGVLSPARGGKLVRPTVPEMLQNKVLVEPPRIETNSQSMSEFHCPQIWGVYRWLQYVFS